MRFNPFPAIGRGCSSFLAWIHQAICALTTEDGRKGWAMLAALGCCIVMTAIVVRGMYWVKTSPMLIFWLALGAMVIILVVITGLMWLLGIRRHIEGDMKEGKFKMTDGGGPTV